MKKNKRPVIHIGLPKAVSTYLQSMFNKDNNLVYLHDEISCLKNGKYIIFYLNCIIKSRFFLKQIVFSHEGLGLSKGTMIFLKNEPGFKNPADNKIAL